MARKNILVIDLDGVNTGPVVAAYLRTKGYNVECCPASRATVGRVITRKAHRAAFEFGLELDKNHQAKEFHASFLEWADTVVVENSNNIKMIQRNYACKILEQSPDYSLLNLVVESGVHIKAQDFKPYLSQILMILKDI